MQSFNNIVKVLLLVTIYCFGLVNSADALTNFNQTPLSENSEQKAILQRPPNFYLHMLSKLKFRFLMLPKLFRLITSFRLLALPLALTVLISPQFLDTGNIFFMPKHY